MRHRRLVRRRPAWPARAAGCGALTNEEVNLATQCEVYCGCSDCEIDCERPSAMCGAGAADSARCSATSEMRPDCHYASIL